MIMKDLITLLCIILSFPSVGQTIRCRFTVRFEDNFPLKNGIIIINRQQVSTDANGHVEVDVAGSTSTASIASHDPAVYTIKFPPNAVVNLPRNPATAIDIIVAKPKRITAGPIGATPADLARLQKAQERYIRSQDALLMKKLEAFNGRLYDSLAVLMQRSHVDKRKNMSGRLEFLPQITNTLHHFLNEAKDLNDAFVVMQRSLQIKEAYEQLAAAIYSYNEIFELINANRSGYEQAIATYWDSKELALKYSNLTEYTLEEIHKPYILEINEAFIARLYGYANEKNRKKRDQLGKALTGDITKHSEALSRRLNSLAERIASFIAILKSVEI